jgi:small-conductance mechanosensitive channel
MSILITMFFRSDNQKIKYPDSVLINKPITNFNRCLDMIEAIDLCVQIFSPIEKITSMKDKIKKVCKYV